MGYVVASEIPTPKQWHVRRLQLAWDLSQKNRAKAAQIVNSPLFAVACESRDGMDEQYAVAQAAAKEAA